MKNIFLAILCFCSIQLFAQPVNDEPCAAITIPVSSGSGVCTPNIGLTWVGATVSATLPFPGCGQWGTGKKDIWYKFTVAAGTNSINIRTASGAGTVDAIMAIYSAPSCSGAFTQVACSDDFIGAMPGFDSVSVSSNLTYYLRVSQYNSNTADGDMMMCLTGFYLPPVIDPQKKVGINVDFPQANLDVNGTTILRSNVQIMSGTPGIGKLLTSDASGNASWQSPALPSPVAFAATLDSTRTLFYNVDTKLHFGAGAIGTVSFNTVGAYSNATDEFTAPSAGIYEFTVRMTCILVAGKEYGVEAHFNLNGNPGFSSLFALPQFAAGSIAVHSAVHTALLNLAAGDKVTVYAKLSSQSVPSAQVTNYAGSAYNSMFWGRKIN